MRFAASRPSAACAICCAASGRASSLAAADMTGQFRVAWPEQVGYQVGDPVGVRLKDPGAVFHRPGHVAGFLAGDVAGDQGWRAQTGRFGQRAGAGFGDEQVGRGEPFGHVVHVAQHRHRDGPGLGAQTPFEHAVASGDDRNLRLRAMAAQRIRHGPGDRQQPPDACAAAGHEDQRPIRREVQVRPYLGFGPAPHLSKRPPDR